MDTQDKLLKLNEEYNQSVCPARRKEIEEEIICLGLAEYIPNSCLEEISIARKELQEKVQELSKGSIKDFDLKKYEAEYKELYRRIKVYGLSIEQKLGDNKDLEVIKAMLERLKE